MSTPHKCPVCEGSGLIAETTEGGRNTHSVDCHACEGKGIVWSPSNTRGSLDSEGMHVCARKAKPPGVCEYCRAGGISQAGGVQC